MSTRFGVNPIGWSNDDLRDLGGKTPLETCLKEGPQVVTKRGAEAAVLVAAEEWRRLTDSARPTLKDLLLADEPRAELTIPPRRWRRRPPTAIG